MYSMREREQYAEGQRAEIYSMRERERAQDAKEQRAEIYSMREREREKK